MSCNVYEKISGITLEGPDISWKKKRGKNKKLHGNLERDVSLYV